MQAMLQLHEPGKDLQNKVPRSSPPSTSRTSSASSSKVRHAALRCKQQCAAVAGHCCDLATLRPISEGSVFRQPRSSASCEGCGQDEILRGL
jgi:hypothetical protein